MFFDSEICRYGGWTLIMPFYIGFEYLHRGSEDPGIPSYPGTIVFKIFDRMSRFLDLTIRKKVIVLSKNCLSESQMVMDSGGSKS